MKFALALLVAAAPVLAHNHKNAKTNTAARKPSSNQVVLSEDVSAQVAGQLATLPGGDCGAGRCGNTAQIHCTWRNGGQGIASADCQLNALEGVPEDN